jgi:hypothetical protein
MARAMKNGEKKIHEKVGVFCDRALLGRKSCRRHSRSEHEPSNGDETRWSDLDHGILNSFVELISFLEQAYV